jgi:hypothetical protein
MTPSEEKKIQSSFAYNILCISDRGEMWYGKPATLQKLFAFYRGYILAIDRCGGRILSSLDEEFRMFIAKKYDNYYDTNWLDVIENITTEEKDRLKIFKENWTDFCVERGVFKKIDGGVNWI